MRFDRIRLENFKCYEETDVRLNPGVTVIHGLNGSGKSSLLEACFFALYGSKALEKTLDEVVTIGAEETRVHLDFTHDGSSYSIRRRLRVRDGTARTAACVLEGPTDTVEGATAVRERVTKLLRMDTEAFVNCAYVRQGEVNKLINASPSDRQDMIDDLLQLGKLEEYRERASDARVGVGRVRDDKRGALNELDEQIQAKAEKKLHEQRNEVQTELATVTDEIDRFETNRENAKETRDQAQEIIDQHEEKRKELETLDSDIDAIRERIEETAREREALGETLSERRTERSEAISRRDDLAGDCDALDVAPADLDRETLQSKIDDLAEQIEELTEEIREKSVEKQEYDSRQESLVERAEQFGADADEAREQASEFESNVAQTRERLEEKREEIETIDERIERQRERFEDAPVEFGEAATHRDSIAEQLTSVRETRAERKTTLEAEREQLEEARSLRAAGKCPECGQPVEDSPHVDAITDHEERIETLETALAELDERIEGLQADLERAEELIDHEETVRELESNKENFEAILDERESALAEKESRIEELREQAATADEAAANKREQAETAGERASECQTAIGELNGEKSELTSRRRTLETLQEVLETIETLDDDIERIREKRSDMEAMNDERRERLDEKRERRTELREEFDEQQIERARQEKEKAKDYLADVDEKLKTLNEQKSKLEGKLGALTNELEELETLRERKAALAETVEQLESLHSETAALEEMYGRLRAELRRQNVQSLERLLNETFDLVYENDTYSRIELDGEYRLTVYQKDGQSLEPDQLSGGERALFNLSLRCAIYRLLAEGIEGTAPMPPLILDEPTVFLDAGHVTQLVELVDSMRERGVEQILVVSHDDELVGAADDLLTVRKDSTTNRSSVQRGYIEENIAQA